MGLFSSFEGGLKTAAAAVTPSSLVNPLGGFATGGAVTDLLGGGVEGLGRDLLGMDPKEPCPAAAGGGGGAQGGDNDPCGQNDDPLKSALLGLGMGLAGPTIASAGAMLGGALDGGLGAVSGAIGGAIGATASGIGGMVGLDPSGPGQALLSGAIGAGAAVGIGGGNGEDAAIGALTAITPLASAITPSAISNDLVSSVVDATSTTSINAAASSAFSSVKSWF